MLNGLSFQNFFKDLGARYKALFIGITGGYIGTIIGLPLPWLLGSLGLPLCVAFTKFNIKFLKSYNINITSSFTIAK